MIWALGTSQTGVETVAIIFYEYDLGDGLDIGHGCIVGIDGRCGVLLGCEASCTKCYGHYAEAEMFDIVFHDVEFEGE